MTTERPRYIYRLDIEYPEGSHEKGWRPARWSDARFLARLGRKGRRHLAAREFGWPRERMFLSSSGAYERAWLLRFYGAVVDVRRSRPVTWPDVPELAGDLELTDDSVEADVLQPEFDAAGLPVVTRDEAWLALSESAG